MEPVSAMYSGRFVGSWCVSRRPEYVDPSRYSLAILFTWESKQNGTSCMFILWAGERYLVFVLCSCCRQTTPGHGTRGTLWLWTHHYVPVTSKSLPSRKVETDVEFVSNVVTRGCKAANDLLNICDFCIKMKSTVLGKRLDSNFSNLDILCYEWRQFCDLYEYSVDFLLHRTGAKSLFLQGQGGTIRRSHIRRGGWHRRYWHIGPIINACHENSWETTKLGCRHMDKTKPEKLVELEKHRARSNSKWLEPKWIQ